MESIQIEAFNTNLHGCRILCQGPFPNKHAPIMDSIQKLKEPFKKKILLTNVTFSFSRYIPLQYDGIFQVKDTYDWTLILTYITYAPKPLLIIAEEIQIPSSLWQKLHDVTFVHITSSYINVTPYDIIFFSPIEELTTQYADHVLKILQSIYKVSYNQKEHKEILQELRVAGAGICWIKEDRNIYWYDPVINKGDSLSNNQMSELFKM